MMTAAMENLQLIPIFVQSLLLFVLCIFPVEGEEYNVDGSVEVATILTSRGIIFISLHIVTNFKINSTVFKAKLLRILPIF